MRLDPIAVGEGVRLESLGTIGSTNAEAQLRARHGDRGPLWITATTQTAGRGRRGRNWISPPGNLYASLLLTDPSPFEQAPQLAFVAALALRDAVVLEVGAVAARLKFKWPNDLLLDGRKCGGILIEGEARSEVEAQKRFIVVIGIGVNCRSHPSATDGNIAAPATDLAAHGAAITPEQLFAWLSVTMCRRLREWDRSRGFAGVLADWLAHARGIGEPIAVRDGDTEVQGRFIGVDQAGHLLLERADGTLTKIAAGDVFPFAASSQNSDCAGALGRLG